MSDKAGSQLTFLRSEEFSEDYANNVVFEVSAWDFKLIFGQVDQSEGKVKIAQHTAITLPWQQAKLLSYWIRAHVEAHELVNGEIPMPDSIIPPEVSVPSEELKKQDANVEAVYGLFNRIREELVADIKRSRKQR
jgi:hypothetical protein